MTPIRRLVATLASSLAGLALSTAALAQGYPSKPITFIVPNPPGGVVDTSARLVGDPLGKALPFPVVIDNRGGASGNVAYGHVARAAPDGYTLLISYSAYHTGNPSLSAKLPWDQKDFVPVALLTVATNVIAMHPSVPANNLAEFIAYAKKNPGKLNYASQGKGSLAHIGTEMFKQQTGTHIVHLPYSGSGAAIKDVLAGEVHLFITTPPSVMGHVQAGKLKALAIASGKRYDQMPTVPTSAEAGLPGFELEAWVGLFAPKGTPQDVIDKLSGEIRKVLESPESRQRAATAGVEIRYLPPAQLADLVKRDTEYWAKVIRTAGITAD